MTQEEKRIANLEQQIKKQNAIIADLNAKLSQSEADIKQAGAAPKVKVGGKTYRIALKGNSLYKNKTITAESIAADSKLAEELVKKGVEYMVIEK